MKITKTQTFLIFAKFWLLLAASIDESESGRITGGHDAVPHSHPYMVSLQLRVLWVRAHFCGGAILSEDWILTAAHCIQESWFTRWLPVDAIAGNHHIDIFGDKAQIVSIGKRVPHPLYQGGIGPHDIAVLKVKTPLIFTNEIQPISLPQPDFKYNNIESLSLTGWGVLKDTSLFFPELPYFLQEVDMTYVPYDECKDAIDNSLESWETNPIDAEANMCTGPMTGGIAACGGDSGGPLVYYFNKRAEIKANDTSSNEAEPNGKINNTENEVGSNSIGEEIEEEGKDNFATVLGVVSWGFAPCGDKGAPTVYTKVSPYVDFIKEQIKDVVIPRQ